MLIADLQLRVHPTGGYSDSQVASSFAGGYKHYKYALSAALEFSAVEFYNGVIFFLNIYYSVISVPHSKFCHALVS